MILLLLASAPTARAQHAYPIMGMDRVIRCEVLRCGATALTDVDCLALGGVCRPGTGAGRVCKIAGSPPCCEAPGPCSLPGGMAGTCVTGLGILTGEGVCVADPMFCGVAGPDAFLACLQPADGPLRELNSVPTGDCDGDGVANQDEGDGCACTPAETTDGCPNIIDVRVDSGSPNVPIDLRGRGGCECRAGGTPWSNVWWLAGVALLWIALRRRSR